MAGNLHVRNLDDDLIARLKRRAARHGRSTEAEHREILRQSLATEIEPSFDQRNIPCHCRKISGKSTLLNLLGAVDRDGGDRLQLRRKVVVERARGDIRRPGDVLDQHVLKPPLENQARRRLADRFAGLLFLAFAQSTGARASCRAARSSPARKGRSTARPRAST